MESPIILSILLMMDCGLLIAEIPVKVPGIFSFSEIPLKIGKTESTSVGFAQATCESKTPEIKNADSSLSNFAFASHELTLIESVFFHFHNETRT